MALPRKIVPIIFFSCACFLQGGDVSAQVFFDLNGTTQPGIDPAFHIRRAYFDFRESISDEVTVRVTSDAGTSPADGRINAYIKFAQVTWKTKLGEFIIGSQPTNYFGALQKTWGYRFIEKYPGNLYGFDATADLGISWRKTTNQSLIQLGAYNGTGFKKPENDAYKRISLLLSHGEQYLSLNAGRNFGGAFSVEPYGTAGHETLLLYRVGGFAGYATASLRAGFDVQIEHDSGLDHQERIVAIYSALKRSDKLSLLGRVDVYDSSVDHPEMRRTTILAGLSYSPAPQFQIAPNVRYVLFGTDLLEPHWVGRLSFYFRL